jgi:MtaA/CmuA family methyltransferase
LLGKGGTGSWGLERFGKCSTLKKVRGSTTGPCLKTVSQVLRSGSTIPFTCAPSATTETSKVSSANATLSIGISALPWSMLVNTASRAPPCAPVMVMARRSSAEGIFSVPIQMPSMDPVCWAARIEDMERISAENRRAFFIGAGLGFMDLNLSNSSDLSMFFLSWCFMREKTLFHPILMHFAARYAGYTYREFASDYLVLVESNLKCLDDFGMDAVGLISDPYREAAAFGGKISFPEEGVPQCRKPVVETLDDIRALKNPDVHQSARTLDRIKAGEILAKQTGGEVPVIGWIEGPLAESCDLAGVNEVLLKLFMEPDFVKQLIDKTMATAKDFARAQVEAGCGIIGVGDAICSQVSADNYREFVKEKHRELFEFIQSMGARVKLHICGNITHLLEDIRDVRPDIVDLDWMVDMDHAYDVLGPGITRCGNLDPVAVIQDKDPPAIGEETASLCNTERDRPFILSGGCEITVNTPPAHLRAMREVSK